MHNVLRKAALGLLAGAAVMTMTLLAEGSAGRLPRRRQGTGRIGGPA
jgi:hypothetical protein